MKRNGTIFNFFVLTCLFFGIFGLAESSDAANHYIRAGATGANNGTNWTDAYTSLPSTLTRGDIYYIADGTYASRTFNDAEDTTKVITIKKATVADHGSETDWLDSYGDGQAVLGSIMSFETGYYTIDGNGTHTVPSNDTNDYGFKIDSATSLNWGGIVRIGVTQAISNITIKYTHIYNSTNGSTCGNATVGIRWHVSHESTYTKIQNSYLQNSGKDGLQMSVSDYILIERNYIERLGKLTPDCEDAHGQTVQMAFGNENIVFRWNVWDSNEGQSLLQMGDGARTFSNIRFYGNIVFNPYGTQQTPGLNSNGCISGNAGDINDTYFRLAFYNNTFVNLRESYTTTGIMCSGFNLVANNNYTDVVAHNNLWYNSENITTTGLTACSFNATGGLDDADAGCTSDQTGLSSAIFTNYTGNDFTLASDTTAGLDLTGEGWWDGGADAFFGQLDYDTDVNDNTRGVDDVWDRGAFEYVSGAPVTTPKKPTGIGGYSN